MTLGEKIKLLRKQKGLTQNELGKLCGMADSAIRRYESGRGNPKLETLKKIATNLDVSVDFLLPDSFIEDEIKQSEDELQYYLENNINIPLEKYENLEDFLNLKKDKQIDAITTSIQKLNLNGLLQVYNFVNILLDTSLYTKNDTNEALIDARIQLLLTYKKRHDDMNKRLGLENNEFLLNSELSKLIEEKNKLNVKTSITKK